MARELRVIDVSRPEALLEPLREALAGNGPALLPVPRIGDLDIPAEVDSEVALVVQTSGSTSKPKRVWHTADSLIAGATQTNEALGSPGTWWLTLPTHYIAGIMVLVRAMVGNRSVIAPSNEDGIGQALINFCDQTDASIPRYTSLVPRQLEQLLHASETRSEIREAFSGLTRVLVGGQRVPDGLVLRASEFGVAVNKTYGSTETAGGCVWDGRPLGATKVVNVDGRVALAGSMLAGGYLGDPERTRESFVERGGTRWYVTDDLGSVVDGRLNVTGRADRVIISAGVKIHLDEVESVLQAQFPGAGIAALPVPHGTWGEGIVVVSTRALPEKEIRGRLAEAFGSAAKLVWMTTVPELPLVSSKKIDRLALMDQLRAQPPATGPS